MDVEYEAGLEMTITVCTSMQLPGTSIKVPASAYVKIKKLSGRVSTSSILTGGRNGKSVRVSILTTLFCIR